MQILVAISCMLAVASAGFLAAPHSVVVGTHGVPLEPAENVAARAAHAAAHAEALARTSGAAVAHAVPYVATTYAGPQHIPVIGANGVPLEPPANVAARAQHAAAHVESAARAASADAVEAVAAHAVPYAAYAGYTYAGAQHIPVIGANGVPLEPPANVAARAQHAAAHVESAARAAAADAVEAVAAHAVPYAAYARYTYAGAQHIPVIGAHGVPLEPAANVAARAQHAAAHVEAAARDSGVVAAYGPYAYAAHGLFGVHHVVGPHGVPAEPAENVAARAAHSAAHIEAKVRNGDLAVLGRRKRGIVGAYHVPVIGANGVPLEPAANVAARAAHAAAHVEAAARSAGVVPSVYGYYPGYAHSYPAIGADGHPLETPEVVAAKSAHFAAHAEANARVAGAVYGPAYAYAGYPHAVPYAAVAHGVPLDTPEVAAAKAAHFNAHVAAKIAHFNAV